jgi:hypothetical protein
MTTTPLSRRARDLTAGIAALLALATPIVLAGVASGDTADSKPVRADLRAVTAKYNAVDQAIADGFAPTDECAALPGLGGMGYHYVNFDRLVDGIVDPDRPDILLYAADEHGRRRLAAVEWFAVDPDQDLTTDSGRPSLFGQAFDGPMPGHSPGMPIHFDLHAWVWEANPTGMFSAWNPAVSCP